MATSRSTVFFMGISLILIVVLSFTVYQILAQETNQPPQVEGVAELGLPGLTNESSKDLAAQSALLLDLEENQISYEQNGFERRPIASLTKLMTAMVALDYGIDWEKEVTIELNEYVVGGNLLLHPGESVTMKDLFYASLLSSANNATLAYARATDVPEEEFVQQMNRKAVELDLEQTRFTETTGLDKKNVSTAYEVAKLSQVAFAYPEIADATGRHQFTFTIKGSNREHTITNSNKLFTEDENKKFKASKTGFIYDAGYCLVVQNDAGTKNSIAVVLGAPTENGQYVDIERLLNRED